MRRAVAAVAAVGVLAGCGGDEPQEPEQDRGAQALEEVTSLEGSEASDSELAFVEQVKSTLSRPYWKSGPEAMVAGYDICVNQTPSAAVFDLVDKGWSEKDAEAFVDAAEKHLC